MSDGSPDSVGQLATAALQRAGELTPPQLAEAIWQVMEERAEAGEPIWAEEYLGRFPALESQPACAVDVIYAEFILRRRRGQGPAPSDYLQRFPRYAELLRRQFLLHEVLGSGAGSRSALAVEPAASTDGAGIASTAVGPAIAADEFRWPGFPDLGNYTVQQCIGRGGMGAVFCAMHRRMNRVVALKVLPPELTEKPDAVGRFQREVETAAQLVHPRIVTAYDADEAHGIHFLVMEYVPGTNLADHVARHGPLSADEALDVVLQAAEGLAYTHQRGVVHRDVKPANLIRDAAGNVRVLDVGLARIQEALAPGDHPAAVLTDSGLTQASTFVGTIDFMAPEQSRDPRAADARADIYSLGCTLYFLLTGSVPFPAGSVKAKLLAHQSQDVPPLPAERGASEKLSAVLRRMLAKRPEERFESMESASAALRDCRSTSAASDAPAASLNRPSHPRLRLIGAASVVLIVLALAAWNWPRRGPSPEPLPPDAQARAQMGDFHVLWKEQRNDEAQDLLTRTHALVESLPEDDPTAQIAKAKLYVELAEAFQLTADEAALRDARQQADALLQAAIQDVQSLDSDSRVAVAAAHRRLAHLSLPLGGGLALHHARADFHFLHGFHDKDPQNPLWKRELSLSLLAQARIQLDLANAAEADRLVTLAVAHDPDNTDALNLRMTLLYGQFDVPFNASRWAEAWEPFWKRHQLLVEAVAGR
jgi:hypothetical protein